MILSLHVELYKYIVRLKILPELHLRRRTGLFSGYRRGLPLRKSILN